MVAVFLVSATISEAPLFDGLRFADRDPLPVYRAVLGPECHVQMRASNEAFSFDGIGWFFGADHPRDDPPAEATALLHAAYLASASRPDLPVDAVSKGRWVDPGELASWEYMRRAPGEVDCVLSPTAVAFSAGGDRALVAVHVDYDGGSTGSLYVLERGGDGAWRTEWEGWLGISCGSPIRERPVVAVQSGLYFDSWWYSTYLPAPYDD